MHDKSDQRVLSWSGFSQRMSSDTSLHTSVRHTTIPNKPPGDYDTIWTVIRNAQRTTKALSQKYTVVTIDQQLYCKAMMIKWKFKKELEEVIILLGGVHIQYNSHLANHSSSIPL